MNALCIMRILSSFSFILLFIILSYNEDDDDFGATPEHGVSDRPETGNTNDDARRHFVFIGEEIEAKTKKKNQLHLSNSLERHPQQALPVFFLLSFTYYILYVGRVTRVLRTTELYDRFEFTRTNVIILYLCVLYKLQWKIIAFVLLVLAVRTEVADGRQRRRVS